jgi:hypothetical protein
VWRHLKAHALAARTPPAALLAQLGGRCTAEVLASEEERRGEHGAAAATNAFNAGGDDAGFVAALRDVGLRGAGRTVRERVIALARHWAGEAAATNSGETVAAVALEAMFHRLGAWSAGGGGSDSRGFPALLFYTQGPQGAAPVEWRLPDLSPPIPPRVPGALLGAAARAAATLPTPPKSPRRASWAPSTEGGPPFEPLGVVVVRRQQHQLRPRSAAAAVWLHAKRVLVAVGEPPQLGGHRL